MIEREGYEQIVDTILADLAALVPGAVQYDSRGNAIASQAGRVEISVEHMGLRLTHEPGEAAELTAAQIADIANAIGDRAATVAIIVLAVGAIAASTGAAAIPIGGGLTVGSGLAATGTASAGTMVAAGGVEVLAGGLIEGDEVHAVGGALNVLGGMTSGAISQVPIGELDELGRAAVVIREILQLGTAQAVGAAQTRRGAP